MNKGPVQENPLRYKDNAEVFHEEYGWGRTFNPRVGSFYVEVKFSNREMMSVHEDDLTWQTNYADKCLAFGIKLGESGNTTWLYTPNEKLDGKCPRDLIYAGDLERVEQVFDETFS